MSTKKRSLPHEPRADEPGLTCPIIHSPHERIKRWLTQPEKPVENTQSTPTVPSSGFSFDGMNESMSWRIFRIMAEFVEGFDFLSRHTKTVSFFGSARCSFANPAYQKAKQLGYLLGREGFTIITGGAPGIMEAGNWGAFEAGAPSVGLNISLAREERRNQYVKDGIGFHHFFTRKVMLSAAAQAYVFFPGGFGTLDELFEIVCLIQTKKITSNVPVILVDKKFWQPMLDWARQTIWDDNLYVDKEELDIMHLVDTPEEACELILTHKDSMV